MGRSTTVHKPSNSALTNTANSGTNPLSIGSQHLPGLGSGQLLPDWVHNLWSRLLKLPTPFH